MTIDHAALKWAAMAATQGKWQRDGSCSVKGPDGRCIAMTWPHPRIEDGSMAANAAYIVAAQPRVMLELLAERERLREALSRYHERVQIDAMMSGPKPRGFNRGSIAGRSFDDDVAFASAALAEKEPTHEGA